MLEVKAYRITYAFSKESEEIYSTVIEYPNLYNAMLFAKDYINNEHGERAFNKVIAISFLEQF
jgi:hypothetical protein